MSWRSFVFRECFQFGDRVVWSQLRGLWVDSGLLSCSRRIVTAISNVREAGIVDYIIRGHFKWTQEAMVLWDLFTLKGINHFSLLPLLAAIGWFENHTQPDQRCKCIHVEVLCARLDVSTLRNLMCSHTRNTLHPDKASKGPMATPRPSVREQLTRRRTPSHTLPMSCFLRKLADNHVKSPMFCILHVFLPLWILSVWQCKLCTSGNEFIVMHPGRNT